jgi:hypothetical protein
MTRDQYEAIAEGVLGATNVPAHAGAEGRRHQHRRFRARTARVPRLTQVQHQVDALVDHVADLLPVAEVSAELVEGGGLEGLHGEGSWAGNSGADSTRSLRLSRRAERGWGGFRRSGGPGRRSFDRAPPPLAGERLRWSPGGPHRAGPWGEKDFGGIS